MDRKKKKAVASKTAAAVEQQRKAMRTRFINRITGIITIIGGEDLLKKFPNIYLEKLYECRYPSLKAKPAPGSEVSKTRIVQFHKLMHQLMEDLHVSFPNGHQIPLSWYLSEGQTLLDAVSEMKTEGDQSLTEIKAAFSEFEFEGKLHTDVQQMVIELVTDTCRFLSDYTGHIYRGNVSETPYFAQFNPSNDILIHTIKPVFEKVATRSGFREAMKLGWINQDFKWQNFPVKASALGFQVAGLDIPLDVYVSSHALRRLKERINITPGIMHEILVYVFLQKKIPHHFIGQESLVDYYVSDQKVGYFVVRLHKNKLLIHTFLFLTNNHTPEGEKLNRLLNLEVTDKKYLEIDNLPDFNSYHIEQNDKLSGVFQEAGCGSLLQLRHLQAFTVNEVNDKDPESILKYLADAPYFKSGL